MALVSTDATCDVGHLVAKTLCLWTFKAKMTNCSTDAAALLLLFQREAIDDRNLLHAVRPCVFKLWTLRIQQRHDEVVGNLNLLLSVALDVNVLRHLNFFIRLKFVANVLATNEDPAPRSFLQSLVVHSSRSNDYTWAYLARKAFIYPSEEILRDS